MRRCSVPGLCVLRYTSKGIRSALSGGTGLHVRIGIHGIEFQEVFNEAV